MRSVRPSRQRPSGKAAPGARACPFLPAEGLPIPARSHRFACGYDQGTTEQKITRIYSGDQVAIFRSDGAEFILLALPKEEASDFHWQKKDHERQPGSALVMVDTRPEIDEARFAQSRAGLKSGERRGVTG